MLPWLRLSLLRFYVVAPLQSHHGCQCVLTRSPFDDQYIKPVSNILHVVIYRPPRGAKGTKGSTEQRATFSPLQPQAVPMPQARHQGSTTPNHPSTADSPLQMKPPMHPQVPACLLDHPRPPAAPPQAPAPRHASLPGAKEEEPQFPQPLPAAGAQAGPRLSSGEMQNGLPPFRTVKKRQPNALQYIQGWLDENPQGHWHPTGEQHFPQSDQSDSNPIHRRFGSMGALPGSFTRHSPWREEAGQPRRGGSAVSDRAEGVRQQILRASRTFGQAQGKPATPYAPPNQPSDAPRRSRALAGLTVLPEIPRKAAFTTLSPDSPTTQASDPWRQTHAQRHIPVSVFEIPSQPEAGTPSADSCVLGAGPQAKADTPASCTSFAFEPSIRTEATGAAAASSSQAADAYGKSDAQTANSLVASGVPGEAEATIASSGSPAGALGSSHETDMQVHIPPTPCGTFSEAGTINADSMSATGAAGVTPQHINGPGLQGSDAQVEGLGTQRTDGRLVQSRVDGNASQHAKGIVEQAEGPRTPEPKRSAQRALVFSPMSVTQPGAQADLGLEGNI